MLVVPAVDMVDLLLTAVLDDNPILDVAGGAFEGVGHRDAAVARIVDSHAGAELGQLLLIDQDIGKGKVQELAQHVVLIAGRDAQHIVHGNTIAHFHILLTSFSILRRACHTAPDSEGRTHSGN